jgi:hypothetical protein
MALMKIEKRNSYEHESNSEWLPSESPDLTQSDFFSIHPHCALDNDNHSRIKKHSGNKSPEN